MHKVQVKVPAGLSHAVSVKSVLIISLLGY